MLIEDNIVKMSLVSVRFKAISTKIIMFFFGNRKTHLKIYMESHETTNSQNHLEKED
jgi:putative heme iron utilization protein